jgi:hypothetical protein
MGLITFVGTSVPGMPGHSALYIEKTVYSFETVGWYGWKIVPKETYLNDPANTWRPAILQNLTRIDAQKCLQFLANDTVILNSWNPANVCSMRAGIVLNAGAATPFQPPAPYTPYELYRYTWYAQFQQYVSLVWRARDKLSKQDLDSRQTQLWNDYGIASDMALEVWYQ